MQSNRYICSRTFIEHGPFAKRKKKQSTFVFLFFSHFERMCDTFFLYTTFSTLFSFFGLNYSQLQDNDDSLKWMNHIFEQFTYYSKITTVHHGHASDVKTEKSIPILSLFVFYLFFHLIILYLLLSLSFQS